MLLVEENHVQTTSTTSEGQMLFLKNRMMADDEIKAEEVDSTYPTKGTQNFGKNTEANEEPLEEGGASMSNEVDKQCHLLATIVGRSTIAKRSAEKEEASRLPQVDKSQLRHQC